MSVPPLSTELALRAFEADASFSSALAQVQAELPDGIGPIPAARAAAAHGFCWLSRPAGDGLIEVRLRHCGGAEAAAVGTSVAHLLAGLLGLTLDTDGLAPEPEPAMQESHQLAVAPEADIDEAAESFAAATDGVVVRRPDDELTAQEKAAAVDIIKAMDSETRKRFTISFRDAFQVPRTERSIIPAIQSRKHLEFIDRFSVEAAGGIGE